MRKIAMRKVPKTCDQKTKHEIMKKWSSVIVETHCPSREIKIISSRELTQTRPNRTVSKEVK